MMDAICKPLPDAAKVAEQLVLKYGPNRVWQVKQLSKRIYRVDLDDGRVLLVTVLDNGMLSIKTQEGM